MILDGKGNKRTCTLLRLLCNSIFQGKGAGNGDQESDGDRLQKDADDDSRDPEEGHSLQGVKGR